MRSQMRIVYFLFIILHFAQVSYSVVDSANRTEFSQNGVKITFFLKNVLLNGKFHEKVLALGSRLVLVSQLCIKIVYFALT